MRAGSTRSAPWAAIVGAGFSGSLLALHLLRKGPPELKVLLIERRAGFGPGLAYRTQAPEHLLNVRIGNMSAFPDRPEHAAEWLCERDGGRPIDPSAFVTRETYGRYIASLIRRELLGGGERLSLAHDEVVALTAQADGLAIEMAMGDRRRVSIAILAIGNLPPAPLPGVGLERLPPGAYVNDPWAPEALASLDATASVLLLGTGLTMVDVAMSLTARGHQGRITAISRRGLLPRAHDRSAATTEGVEPSSLQLSEAVRWARRRADAVGWRAAVDALRPFTQSLWRRADLDTRRRFLRHLRPWWDVHRHRMAPAIADRIGAMRAQGQLLTLAGRVLQATADGSGAGVTWRLRGAAASQAGRFDRVINCTGPGGGPSQAREPLIRSLLERGAARMDALGLGLEVDDKCRVIASDGAADPRLYAVGPLTRGSFWEIVAVPDIRNQVAAVGEHLAGQFAKDFDQAAPARLLGSRSELDRLNSY